jgi:Kef-type K+ transport system membrane component KefB
LINASALDEIGILIDLALGLIIFELGRRLDYKWLLSERSLLATAVVISLSIFLGLFSLLILLGSSKLVAGLAAAVGMATSPAVVLNVVRETRAEGQVSERMLNIVAIGNSIAFIIFTMCLSAQHMEYSAGWETIVLHPPYLIGVSIGLGWLGGQLLIYVSRWLGRDSVGQHIVTFGLIAAIVGLAEMFKLSALMALLVLGFISRSSDHRHAIIDPDFSQISSLLYVILFVYAGARLEPGYLHQVWFVALAFIVVRCMITISLSSSFASYNGLSVRKGALLGLGLLPMSGVAIILGQRVSGIYPAFGPELSALMLSVVVIMEILGPICTRYALVASGEAQTGGKA